MKRQQQASALIVAVVAPVLFHVFTTPVEGQAPRDVKVVSAAPTVPVQNPFLPKRGPAPRNADGHADLNGQWDFRTSTPVQRAPAFGDKLFLTAEEGAALQKRNQEAFNPDVRNANAEFDAYSLGMNAAWFDYGGPLAQSRTSLVVDPPNGRIPPLTPEAKAQMVQCAGIGQCGPLMLARGDARHMGAADEKKADHVTDRSLTERCLVVRSGPPLESTAWNNNVHIFHTKDVVVFQTEMVHSARVVWLDGRPHVNGGVQQWQGNSRGRWEGDTLVIETTNFRPEAVYLGVMHPEKFKLVERLTRIDADTVMYEYTVNDPETYTRPWTAQLPMRKLQGYMYEYACHEGNYGLKYQLMAARHAEKELGSGQAASGGAK